MYREVYVDHGHLGHLLGIILKDTLYSFDARHGQGVFLQYFCTSLMLKCKGNLKRWNANDHSDDPSSFRGSATMLPEARLSQFFALRGGLRTGEADPY